MLAVSLAVKLAKGIYIVTVISASKKQIEKENTLSIETRAVDSLELLITAEHQPRQQHPNVIQNKESK